MKKQMTILMGLALLPMSAFASKARLEALGENHKGSMFLDDTRNVFLNPATLNFHKDFVTFELGNTKNHVDKGVSAVNTAPLLGFSQGPRSEGGVFMAQGNMVYGLYFGNEGDSSNALRNSFGLPEEQNSVDLFIAGDAGVQWGVDFHYQNYSSDKSDIKGGGKSNVMSTRIGFITGDISSYVDIGLAGTAENSDGSKETEGKGSYEIGVTYNVGEIDFMLSSEAAAAEFTSGSTVSDVESSKNSVGIAKTYKLNDKANMWLSAFYVMSKSDKEIWGSESEETTLPIKIALEVAASDWLTLRGSIGQNVFINENDDGTNSGSIPETTIVNFGLSLVYDDLTLDTMLGNDPSAGDLGGKVSGQDTFGRFSMTYKF